MPAKKHARYISEAGHSPATYLSLPAAPIASYSSDVHCTLHIATRSSERAVTSSGETKMLSVAKRPPYLFANATKSRVE